MPSSSATRANPRVLLRIATAAILPAFLYVLVASSTTLAVLSPMAALEPIGGWHGVLVLALLAFVAVPVLLGVAGLRTLLTASVLAAGVHLYAYSRLDWMRLLKEFCTPTRDVCLTASGPAPLGSVLLAASPILLTLAWHVLDHAAHVHARAREKGAPGDEPRLAAQAVLAPGVRVLAFTLLLGAAVVASHAVVAPFAQDAAGAVAALPLLAPLAVAGLALAAAYPAFRKSA